MKTTIELAKDLLRKGKLLNDIELISMANDLLNSVEVEEKTVDNEKTGVKIKAAGKRGRPKKQEPVVAPVKKSTRASMADFKVKEGTVNEAKRVPVNETYKTNNWKDDGISSKDDITPTIPLTKRDRKPLEKIAVICGLDEEKKPRSDIGCGETFHVHPSLVKELFVCEDCLLKRKKRR